MHFTRRTFLALLPLTLTAQTRQVIVLLGPPGAGKTTQAKILKTKTRLPILSMSELLKKAVGRKTEVGKLIKVAIDSGDLVNDDLANDLIRERTTKGDTYAGFILDGYPASAKQSEYLDALLKDRGLPPAKVILIEVPDEIARQRMGGRGRSDDKPEHVDRRMALYKKETTPVVEYYASKGLARVDGTKPEAEVAAAIEAARNR